MEERSLASGDPLEVEYRIRRADGEWVWLTTGHGGAGQDGHPICLQGMMFDITKRRAEEERLISLDRLKNTLLHTLSHDLKAPLTAILVAASTLERLGDELEDDVRRHMLRTLVERSRGMNALLTDLLDLDRLDSGIVAPRRYPLDLHELIRGLFGQDRGARRPHGRARGRRVSRQRRPAQGRGASWRTSSRTPTCTRRPGRGSGSAAGARATPP